MNCREFERLHGLTELFPKVVREPVRRRLDRHAADCSRCRRFSRRFHAVPGLLRRAYQEEAAAYTVTEPLPAHLGRKTPHPGLWLWRGAAVTAAVASAAVLASRFGAPPHQRLGIRPGSLTAPHPAGTLPDARQLAPKPSVQVDASRSVAPRRPFRAGPAVEAASANRPDQKKRSAAAPPPDREYLDGRDPQLASTWMVGDAHNQEVHGWLFRHLPPMKDDFVQVPLPLLADADGKAAGTALRKYEEEAKVVDTRLFRKVTLACKAMPLDEFCAQLSEKTGVKIQVSRGVRDEKVTVLVENLPARDVMREVARLFGYLFARTGEPATYKYELLQDLRSQLAEEEMRSKDVHAALLDLDQKMGAFQPYLQQSVESVITRVQQNKDGKDAEANRLFRFVRGGWGAALVYFHLTPAERSALLGGQELRYSTDAQAGERRLPTEWKETVMKASGLYRFPSGTISEPFGPSPTGTPVHQLADMEPEVLLKLDQSEAGEFSLWVGTRVYQIENGQKVRSGGSTWPMSTGSSPSTHNPENARLNAAHRAEPQFQARISLVPQPSCPVLAEDAERKRKDEVDRKEFIFEAELKEPHVNTADVWEEIHRRTGLPVVADSYTHLFPVSKLTVQNDTTFDALCHAGDAMGVRWRKDGGFLLGRSTSFFWDKLKEVPNRLLRAWQADRDRNGGLPLEDLFQIAGLSDQQLGSKTVGMGITHCWGLDEWGLIAGGPFHGGDLLPQDLRKHVRALGVLSPAQLAQAQKPEGLSLKALSRAQVEVFSKQFGWDMQNVEPAPQMRVEYAPRGRYLWEPLITRERYEAEGKHWPRITAKTREEALAAARKWDPNADPSSVRRTRGRLDILWRDPEGRWVGTGGPRVLAPLD